LWPGTTTHVGCAALRTSRKWLVSTAVAAGII
jgi:hypothetical protein